MRQRKFTGFYEWGNASCSKDKKMDRGKQLMNWIFVYKVVARIPPMRIEMYGTRYRAVSCIFTGN